jgi:pyruvate kinase
MVAKHRPVAPILGLTPDEATLRRMGLYWGVEPVPVGEANDIQAMTRMLDGLLPRLGRARRGDRVVVVAGFPFGKGVHSNMVFIHRVG